MKKACMRLTDAVWTMTYTINADDGSLTIQNFDKEDNDGYMFAESLGVLNGLEELDGDVRIVDKVTIDGVTYDVRNKQNVFTYKQPL
jgi:hypothetical protein